MKGQTLQAIDKGAILAAEFLKEYTSDKKKRECLTAFAECKEIVKWIRNETKGIYN